MNIEHRNSSVAAGTSSHRLKRLYAFDRRCESEDTLSLENLLDCNAPKISQTLIQPAYTLGFRVHGLAQNKGNRLELHTAGCYQVLNIREYCNSSYTNKPSQKLILLMDEILHHLL